jgi:hypothetical protein
MVSEAKTPIRLRNGRCERGGGRRGVDKPCIRNSSSSNPQAGGGPKGANRLQHAAHILEVPVPFFFEGAPGQAVDGTAPSPSYVNEFVSS